MPPVPWLPSTSMWVRPWHSRDCPQIYMRLLRVPATKPWHHGKKKENLAHSNNTRFITFHAFGWAVLLGGAVARVWW